MLVKFIYCCSLTVLIFDHEQTNQESLKPAAINQLNYRRWKNNKELALSKQNVNLL